MKNVQIIIPARIGSTRLKNKMIADINGVPLIVRTYRNAIKANVGDVIVACDGSEICKLIEREGGRVTLTDPNLPSGTDRVYAAVKSANLHSDIIVNLQGDHPYIDPEFIKASVTLCKNDGVDISTPIVKITDESYKVDSIVKPVVTFYSDIYAKAHYFSRAAVPFSGPYYHHVGVYAYKMKALEMFMTFPQSELEKSEKLEQLRAIENGLNIHTVLCDLPPPLSVDTQDDLKKAVEIN